VPLGGGTGAADAEAVLAGVAAETLVATGSAVVRVGLQVDAGVVADGVLVEILQDADVVHALVAGVAWRLTLSADAVLARRADVAARAAVVPVTDHIDALPVAELLTGLRTAARAEEA
jgi:hypothetical protein